MQRILLDTTTSRSGDRLTLTCNGSAETDAWRSLHDVLTDVHDEAVRTTTRTVIADVRSLEFASSSCLKEFVTWLQRVQELDDEKRYRVVFKSDPRHSWQRRSLGALAAFASGVVRIESEPS
jgi:hypothetical protein